MAETQSPVSPSAVGTWLCHYTTADAAFEYILPTGQLRMSPYDTFPAKSPRRGSW